MAARSVFNLALRQSMLVTRSLSLSFSFHTLQLTPIAYPTAHTAASTIRPRDNLYPRVSWVIANYRVHKEIWKVEGHVCYERTKSSLSLPFYDVRQEKKDRTLVN